MRTVFARTDGHTRRLKGWDYAKGASLFITISTEPRRPFFGRVSGSRVVLSSFGERVKAALEIMPALNPGISLFGHVVMPDHVHFNVHLAAGMKEPLKVLGNAIRRFKNHTLKVARMGERSSPISTAPTLAIPQEALRGAWPSGGAHARASCDAQASGDARDSGGARDSGDARTVFAHLWQNGYHDHLCLNRRFIDSTERYIAYNPLKWALMHGAGSLHVREPLDSPRLDIGDYWKGVGNVALLGPALPMVSLRVSRKVADLAAVVARLERAVDKGYVVISGFISKGEQAVRDMLCRRPDARFIRILPSCIPNARFKPESRYVAPFAEDRYLEIARGNDETEFGRAACLDLNDEIVKIATAGEGLALYWKEDGPHVLVDSSRLSPSNEGVQTKHERKGAFFA